MKKHLSFWWRLTAQITIVFFIGMMMTFVNDLIQCTGFFGDILLSRPKENDFMVDEMHEWGARHYWYFWLMVILFILSLVRIVLWINWFWSKENKKRYL